MKGAGGAVMSQSVLDFLVVLKRRQPADYHGPTHYIAQRIGMLRECIRRLRWKTLARSLRLERPDPHVFLQEGPRVVVAFILSYVLVVTVGTMVLPNTARKLKPTPPTGPVAVTPSLDFLPGGPALVALRIDDPSKHHNDAASRSGANEVPAEYDLKIGFFSKVPIGPRQTTTVGAQPGNARGRVARVTDITLWGTPSRPWVSIIASGPVRYRLRNVQPDWVVVDIPRAQLALASGKPPAGRGLVREIRAGQFTQNVVRVVLELTERIPVHIATSPDKTAIIVTLAVKARGNGNVPSTFSQEPAAE